VKESKGRSRGRRERDGEIEDKSEWNRQGDRQRGKRWMGRYRK
jgi:hypothetical protein